MKIISLVGSPHKKKGNTSKLLDIVLEGARSLGAKTEIIYLPGDTVLPCRGCDLCHKKGICSQNDEFHLIRKKILGADGLILASPNYIFCVSAQLKAFMDRCCGVIHCMEFEGKYGASVVTSGGGDEPPIADYMNHFLITTGIRPVGSVWATMGTITGDEFPEDIIKQAVDLGKKLVNAIEKKTINNKIEKKRAEFKQRMRNLVTWQKNNWKYEYDYWVTHHGLKRIKINET